MLSTSGYLPKKLLTISSPYNVRPQIKKNKKSLNKSSSSDSSDSQILWGNADLNISKPWSTTYLDESSKNLNNFSSSSSNSSDSKLVWRNVDSSRFYNTVNLNQFPKDSSIAQMSSVNILENLTTKYISADSANQEETQLKEKDALIRKKWIDYLKRIEKVERKVAEDSIAKLKNEESKQNLSTEENSEEFNENSRDQPIINCNFDGLIEYPNKNTHFQKSIEEISGSGANLLNKNKNLITSEKSIEDDIYWKKENNKEKILNNDEFVDEITIKTGRFYFIYFLQF